MMGSFPDHFHWALLVLLAVTFPFMFSILFSAITTHLTHGVSMFERIGTGFIVGFFGSAVFFLYLVFTNEGSTSGSYSPNKLRDTLLIVATTLLSGLATALIIFLYANYLNAPPGRKN